MHTQVYLHLNQNTYIHNNLSSTLKHKSSYNYGACLWQSEQPSPDETFIVLVVKHFQIGHLAKLSDHAFIA